MTSDEFSETVSTMWARLAQQLADAIPDLVIGGQPALAMQYAASAEACFWQATGDGDAYSIKSAVEQFSAPTVSSEDPHP